MKTKFFVSKRELDVAVYAVQRELQNIGLWNEDSRLTKADVLWCMIPNVTLPRALGYFIHKESAMRSLGYKQGHIYIPSPVLGRRRLRDVVRHEYGHAVAHYYPGLVRRSPRFTATFAGTYDRGKPIPSSDARDFVSPYAATEPAEDFAETFMIYLRRGGKIPTGASRPVARKWRYISDLTGAIASGRRRWIARKQ